MTFEEFAKLHGYNDYDEMKANSFTVIFDHGTSWIASVTHEGWIAWVDKSPDKPSWLFETFEAASNYIMAAFEESELVTKQLTFIPLSTILN